MTNSELNRDIKRLYNTFVKQFKTYNYDNN